MKINEEFNAHLNKITIKVFSKKQFDPPEDNVLIFIILMINFL